MEKDKTKALPPKEEATGKSMFATIAANMALAAIDAMTGTLASKELHQAKDELLERIFAERAERDKLQGGKISGPEKLQKYLDKQSRKKLQGGKDSVAKSGDNVKENEKIMEESEMSETTNNEMEREEKNARSLIRDNGQKIKANDSADSDIDENVQKSDAEKNDETVSEERRHEHKKMTKNESSEESDDDDFITITKQQKAKQKRIIRSDNSSSDEEIRQGEIKVGNKFTAVQARELLIKTPEENLVREVIQHPIKSNTVYVFDIRGSEFMWWLDDRVRPNETVRDWLIINSEARPRRANKKEQLYARKYMLRDNGNKVNFWRTVYTDLKMGNLKTFKASECAIQRVLVHFEGSSNPNTTRSRERHGNLGRAYKLYGKNQIPGVQNSEAKPSEKTDSLHGPVYEKKTQELQYKLDLGFKEGKDGSNLYRDALLESATKTKTLRPPRNIKQVRNAQAAKKRQLENYDDDMVDVAHMARSQGGKIIRQYNLYPMLLITRHEGLQNHFGDVIKKGTPVIAHYDTTFNLGPRFVSILSLKQPWLLTGKNQQPTIPIAALYHEGQEATRTHEPFLQLLAEDIQGFDSSRNVIITDREGAIRKAVKNKLPNVRHAFCHNHIRRNVKQWTTKHYPGKEARRYRKQFKQLLFAGNENELNSLLKKYCPGDNRIEHNLVGNDYDEFVDETITLSESDGDVDENELPWDEKMADYYFKYQDKDLRNSYRGAFTSLGIFNKNSGITNNPAENINMVFQKTILKNKKTPTQYECVQNMYKWQNQLYFDIGRGLKQTGGEFKLNSKYKKQASDIPAVELDDHEVLFDDDQRKVVQPEKIVKLAEYCNFDAKKTMAVEILQKGLVEPVVTKEGCKGLYIVNTAKDKYVLVHPKAKKCSCGNAKCEHKIAVSMLTGDFDENNPTLMKGEKEGTLTKTYESTKIRGVGKKWGQKRNPQTFDNQPENELQDPILLLNDEMKGKDDNNITFTNRTAKETEKIPSLIDGVKSLANEREKVPSIEVDLARGKDCQIIPSTPSCSRNLNFPAMPKMDKENYKCMLFKVGERSFVYLSDLKHIPEQLEESEAEFIKDFIPGWFNDNVMYAYIYEMSDKDKTLVIDPLQLDFVMSGQQEKWVQEYTRKMTKSHGNKELILMPTHVHGNHWVLLAARRDCKILLMDPMRTYKPTGNHTANISTFLNVLFDKPKGTSWTVEQLETVIQKDGRSCGPFTCYFAKALQTGGSLLEKPPPHFREEILETIIGNCNLELSLEFEGHAKLGERHTCSKCNEVEPPKNSKYRVGEAVHWLQCDRCNAWRHIRCSGISRRDAKQLKRWVCS